MSPLLGSTVLIISPATDMAPLGAFTTIRGATLNTILVNN